MSVTSNCSRSDGEGVAVGLGAEAEFAVGTGDGSAAALLVYPHKMLPLLNLQIAATTRTPITTPRAKGPQNFIQDQDLALPPRMSPRTKPFERRIHESS